MEDPGGTVSPALRRAAAGGSTVWRRAPRWAHRVAADQVVLAAPGGARRTLEGQAAAVWVELAEPGSLAELADRMRRRWPEPVVAPPDEAGAASGADLAVTLGLLADHGVIEVAGPSSP